MTQKVTSWKQLDDDVDQMLTWNLCEPHSSCMLRSLDVDTAAAVAGHVQRRNDHSSVLFYRQYCIQFSCHDQLINKLLYLAACTILSVATNICTQKLNVNSFQYNLQSSEKELNVMVKTFDFFYRFYSFKLLGTTVGYMSKKQPSDNPTKAASRSEKENFENKGDRRIGPSSSDRKNGQNWPKFSSEMRWYGVLILTTL